MGVAAFKQAAWASNKAFALSAWGRRQHSTSNIREATAVKIL